MAIDRALAPLTVDLGHGRRGRAHPHAGQRTPSRHAGHPHGRKTTAASWPWTANWKTRGGNARPCSWTCSEAWNPTCCSSKCSPFGRRVFARELLPLLNVQPGAAASGRDPVQRARHPRREEGTRPNSKSGCSAGSTHGFDGVLVHSDPELIPAGPDLLARGRHRLSRLVHGLRGRGADPAGQGPPRSEALGLPADGTVILASAGSGTIIRDLLDPIMEASILLAQTMPHKLLMFTGPQRPPGGAAPSGRTQRRAHPDAVVREFTPRFPDHVLACDLSVSRGGYNTTMNLLACGARGLMHPYGHDREQRMRLEALSALGHVGLLQDLRSGTVPAGRRHGTGPSGTARTAWTPAPAGGCRERGHHPPTRRCATLSESGSLPGQTRVEGMTLLVIP